MAKKELKETDDGRNNLSGFGDNVVKLTDQESGEVVAYIGKQEGVEKIHFAKAVTPEQLEAVHELVQKKKFNKHILKDRFEKAQAYADKRFE